MADRIRIMVSGNKPRLSVRMEGDQLVVDCSKCFAEFLRKCKLASDRKGEMPTLASAAATCMGYYGHATFPKDAYDIIVAHAGGKKTVSADIPISLQGGVTTETPIPTSQSDIERIVDKKIAERSQDFLRYGPEAAATVQAETVTVRPTNTSNNQGLDAEWPMPEPINASKAAIELADKNGIDLSTVVSEKGEKIDVRDVRRTIRERK